MSTANLIITSYQVFRPGLGARWDQPLDVGRKLNSNQWQCDYGRYESRSRQLWHTSYLVEPKAWNCNDRRPSGLNHGVEVILTAPTSSKLLWIEANQQRSQFKDIRDKFRAVEEAKDEVEVFKNREEKDDSNFVIY